MLNNVTLTGRLTNAPEMRFTPEGIPVANFTLAVNKMVKPKNGEKDADFFPMIVWRERAELMANTLEKGSLIGIVGRLQTRDYEKADGQKVYITEIVISDFTYLEKKKDPADVDEQPSRVGSTASGYVSRYQKK